MSPARAILALLLWSWALPGPARPAGSPPVPELPPVAATTFRRPLVVGWEGGQAPVARPGFQVERFAKGFDSPRWLYVLPNGDVLVAQARTERMGGLPADVEAAMTAQGLFGESADNIILLRRSGESLQRTVFVENLRQPFGMLLLDNYFYVANTDSLVRFRYRAGDMRLTSAPELLIEIPAGDQANPWNNHWTRNIVATPDGLRLMLSVGSGTDADAEGIEPADRAAIWELAPDGSGKRLYATGLRNPVGLDFEPLTGALWTTVNERDGLGPDVPPDFMTRVVDGAFYGWPYVYFGTYPDPTQARLNPAAVRRARAAARVPDLQLGGHSVPLGLLFYRGDMFPERYRRGAFVARRAGVGRSQFIGPDVIFVAFGNGAPTGEIERFLGGFVADEKRGEVHGRPVGLATLPDGSLLVSDDAANVIWRVSYGGVTADQSG